MSEKKRFEIFNKFCLENVKSVLDYVQSEVRLLYYSSWGSEIFSTTKEGGGGAAKISSFEFQYLHPPLDILK